MLAQEQTRYSSIVAQCIEAHIRRIPPTMKLPAFYLLDAISKNVYVPYAAEFTPFVVPLFLETYDLVDNNTRSKMEEMLLTWRTGSPVGKELFGIGPQVAIERGIWGDGGNAASGSSSRVTPNQVMSELDFAIGQQERTLQSRPHDVAMQNNLAILHQLHALVAAGVSQPELKQILNQLRTLMRNSASTSAPPPPPIAASPPPPPPPQHQAPYAQPQNHYWKQDLYPQQQIPHPAPMPAVKIEPASALLPAAGSPDILSMLTNLVKSGVVSSNGTPIGAGSSSVQEIPDEKPDSDRLESRAYRDSILRHSVALTTSDVTRPRNHLIIECLYDTQSTQCKQCGQRFADSPSGQKKLEKHLDMHFVQNRQASQQTGRGHHRGWFISLDDWINDTVDVKGKGVDRGPARGRAAEAADQVKRNEELRAMFVVVPPGDEAKSIRCPICKETLKSEFLEDDEEWVWKNAVKKDDTVYHATCHSEAAASATTLVTRLIADDSSSRSRSVTPETNGRIASPRSSPLKNIKSESSSAATLVPGSPSSLAGMKRKAEYDEDGAIRAEEAPLKKVAV